MDFMQLVESGIWMRREWLDGRRRVKCLALLFNLKLCFSGAVMRSEGEGVRYRVRFPRAQPKKAKLDDLEWRRGLLPCTLSSPIFEFQIFSSAEKYARAGTHSSPRLKTKHVFGYDNIC